MGEGWFALLTFYFKWSGGGPISLLTFYVKGVGEGWFVLLTFQFKGAGGGGPRPNIVCYAIFVEGKQSYQIQMLFTGSKNIDRSRIYRISKIAKYIQLLCVHALYLRLSQNFKFEHQKPISHSF